MKRARRPEVYQAEKRHRNFVISAICQVLFRHGAGGAVMLMLILSIQCGGADDKALERLLHGNELAGQGRHLEAIEAWRFVHIAPQKCIQWGDVAVVLL